MQLLIKCVNKNEIRKALLNKKRIPVDDLQVCVGTQSRKNRLYVYDPQSRKWTIGFKSYDGRGVVYYSPMVDRFLFSGFIIEKHLIKSRNLHCSMDRGELIFERKLQQGIETEKKVCQDLEPYKGRFYVHRLERSGLHSRGTDIVISKEKDKDEDPFLTVIQGVCGIEVLGACIRYGNEENPLLAYRRDKNFDDWRTELVNNNVLPVIAWRYNELCFYVVLTKKILLECFYITTKKNGFHQQTNYLPAKRLEPYAFTASQLFDSIRRNQRKIKSCWGEAVEVEGG